MSTKTKMFPPRVRFNWGFHDAQHDATEGRPARDMTRHFDRFYVAGYTEGTAEYKQTKARNESSEPAWKAFTARLVRSIHGPRRVLLAKV